MNKMIFVLLVLIVALSGVGSAFSDNFNDGTLNAWDVVSGAVTIQPNSFVDGTDYAQIAATAYLQKNIGTATIYYSVDFNQTGGGTAKFYFRANPSAVLTDSCVIQVSGTQITSANLVSCSGVTAIAAVPVSTGKGYRVIISDFGNTMNYKVYNVTNGNNTLISNQNVSDSTATIPVYNYVRLTATGANAGFDNIVVSGALPSVTTSVITWGTSEYTRGQTASFTWQITDSDWASFDRYFVRLYKNGVLQDFSSFNFGCLCHSQLSLGSQTGTYSLLADDPGTWEVTLEKATASSLWISFVIVGSDETRIRDYSSSYFLIPATALIKTNISVTYHVGIGGIQSGIEWFYLNNGVEQRERGINLGTTTDGTINVTFSKVGTYNVYLKSLTGTSQTFDTHSVITSFISGGTPTNNFSTSDINLLPVNGTGGSGATYSMNDVLYGNYSIKGTTFSGEGVFFIDVYNNDSGAETAKFFEDFGGSVGLLDNGLFAYLISNNANQPNGQLTQFQPGNNSIRLMLQNPDFTYTVLATDQFVLSRTNVAGYGLDVNPLNVIVGQNVNAVVTSPAATGVYLRITGKNNYNKSYPIPAGTRTITTTFDTPGIYGYNLYDPTGDVQMTTQVTVTAGTTPTPTPSIQAQSDITNLMSSRIFWALIFIVGIMIAVAVKERGGK